MLKQIILAFLFINTASAAIDDYYKEVMQRGYAMDGDSVIMPDGSKCLLDDFNNGLCGKEFFDQPYCIPEGRYVWDDGKCCEGLIAYLPEGVDGQATCQKKGKVDFGIIIRNPILWLSIFALTVIVYTSLFLAKKFIRKQ